MITEGDKNMRKILLVGLILSITTLFIGCGKKEAEVSQAYLDYISQAKVEIVNEDYVKAEKFLTLAYDENQEDRVVLELKEQLDIFNRLKNALNDPSSLSNEDLLVLIEEGIEVTTKEFSTNLLLSDIEQLVHNLDSTVVANIKDEEELDRLRDSFYEAIENNETENIVEVGEKIKDKIHDIKMAKGDEFFEVNYPQLESEVRVWMEMAEQDLFLKEQKMKNPSYYENLLSLMQNDIEQSGGEIFREYLIAESIEYITGLTYCIDVSIEDETANGLIRNISYKIDATNNKIPEYFIKEDRETGEITRIDLN